MFKKKEAKRLAAMMMAIGLFLTQVLAVFGADGASIDEANSVSINTPSVSSGKTLISVVPLDEKWAFQQFEFGSEGTPQLPETLEISWEQEVKVAPTSSVDPTLQDATEQATNSLNAQTTIEQGTSVVLIKWELQRIELYPVVDNETASNTLPENEIFTAEDGELSFSTESAGVFTYKATIVDADYTLGTGVELPTITATVMQAAPVMMMATPRSGATPWVDTANKRVFANGYPITIQAGTANSQIFFTDSTDTVQYLTLDESVPYSLTATDIDVSNYTIFGGGNGTAVDSTSITMNGGAVKTIYGGGYNGDVTNHTVIALNSGAVGLNQPIDSQVYVFGGGLADGGNAASNTVTISYSGTTIGHDYNDWSNSAAGYLFGGGHSNATGSQASVGFTSMTITSGTIVEDRDYPYLDASIFGGGYAQTGTANSGNVNISVFESATLAIQGVYGGAYVSGGATSAVGAVEINATVSTNDSDFSINGGSNNDSSTSSATVQSTNVTVSGSGYLSGLSSGGSNSTILGDALVKVSGAVTVEGIIGTGYRDYVGGSVVLNILSDITGAPTINESVAALAYQSIVFGNTTVNVTNATVKNSILGGGGYNNYVGYNSSKIKNDDLSSLTTTVTGSSVGGSIYGGGLGQSLINGNTFVNVTDTAMTNNGSIYGGIGAPPQMRSADDYINFNASGALYGNTNVVVKTTVGINTIYGGGVEDVIYGKTEVGVQGSSAQFVFGGGVSNAIYKSANVKLSGSSTISGSVFGGSFNETLLTKELFSLAPSEGTNAIIAGTILENTNVSIAVSDVTGNIYGGGILDNIKGNTYVEFLSGSVQNVFGSGTTSAYGDFDVNTSYSLGFYHVTGSSSIEFMPSQNGGNTTVKIIGGTVKGDVYGSGEGFNLQSGNTDVIITGGTVNGNIYGGGNYFSLVGYTFQMPSGSEPALPFAPLSGRGDTSVKVFEGSVNSVVGGGNSESGYNSSVNGNVFVFIDANATVRSNEIYKQLREDTIISSFTIVSVNGKSTFVVENNGIRIKETQTVASSTDEDIENILRWEQLSSYTQPHWMIKGEVVLPVDITGSIAITQNQELYMPEGTNLIAGESSSVQFNNEGYIVTQIPTLDSSIESNNVPGKTNLHSRIYRGGEGAGISLVGASYTLNQAATALNANPALTGFWQFLGTKIGEISGYTWQQGSSVLSGQTSAIYLPPTNEVGTKTYSATITAPYRFESVPANLFSNVFKTSSANIIVTNTTPQPPATSSNSSSSSSSSTGGGTATPLVPGGDDDESSSQAGSSSSQSSSSSSSSSSQTSSSSSSSGSVGQGTEDDSEPPKSQITPGGGIILSPSDPNNPIDDVYVGGEEVDPNDYRTDDNGNVTLNPSFLATLDDGEHTVGVRVDGQLYEATIIMEGGIPLSSGSFSPVSDSAWSLFDLIMTILALLSPIVYIILVRKRKEDETEEPQVNSEEQEETSKRRTLTVIIGIILGFINLILFLLTQDLTQPMVFFDRYSIWFALIFIVQTIVEVVFRRKRIEEERKQSRWHAT